MRFADLARQCVEVILVKRYNRPAKDLIARVTEEGPHIIIALPNTMRLYIPKKRLLEILGVET